MRHQDICLSFYQDKEKNKLNKKRKTQTLPTHLPKARPWHSNTVLLTVCAECIVEDRLTRPSVLHVQGPRGRPRSQGCTSRSKDTHTTPGLGQVQETELKLPQLGRGPGYNSTSVIRR